MGRLPLVEGMPVIIGENYDVEGGIINGSEGTLKSVRYKIGDQGQQHVMSCIVHVPNSTKLCLPHLAPHDIVVLEETTMINITHPETRKIGASNDVNSPSYLLSQ